MDTLTAARRPLSIVIPSTSPSIAMAWIIKAMLKVLILLNPDVNKLRSAPVTLERPMTRVIVAPFPEISSNNCVEKNIRMLIPPSYWNVFKRHPRRNLFLYFLVNMSLSPTALMLLALAVFLA